MQNCIAETGIETIVFERQMMCVKIQHTPPFHTANFYRPVSEVIVEVPCHQHLISVGKDLRHGPRATSQFQYHVRIFHELFIDIVTTFQAKLPEG